VVGSLRKGSFNRKLALALAAMALPELALKIVEIGRLPLCNQDLDEQPPAAWVDLKQRIAPSDAVLFITLEYARCGGR
jgi:chromate reductase